MAYLYTRYTTTTQTHTHLKLKLNRQLAASDDVTSKAYSIAGQDATGCRETVKSLSVVIDYCTHQTETAFNPSQTLDMELIRFYFILSVVNFLFFAKCGRLSWLPVSLFYPRDAMLARVFATATCLSVCLSGRPSVTRRYCA